MKDVVIVVIGLVIVIIPNMFIFKEEIMSEEIKAKDLIPGDEVRHSICGFTQVRRVFTGFIEDMGIRTTVEYETGSEIQYYPEDYIQIN